MDRIIGPAQRFGMTFLGIIIASTYMDSLPMRIDDNFIPNDSYDFVVVGSGAGGSVVAARLAETGAEVLLLEAGAAAPVESIMPGITGTQFAQNNNWRIVTEPNSGMQQAFIDNRVILLAGKVLGGSTSINGMHYLRGNSRDFDNWARLGNPGWDYKSVLPYYKKSEDFHGIKTAETDKYHGTGGPVNVEATRFDKPVAKAFFKAGLELGYKKIDDFGPSQIGFATCHYTMKEGVRVSTSEAFLRPNLHRANLHIRTEAMVRKIIFNSAKRAVSVSYDYKKKNRMVGIRKEVVVSAGAALTPKLLMLSGVGPKEHLQEKNIPIVANLQGVGQNLQDHPVSLGLAWEVRSNMAVNLMTLLQPFEFLRYLTDRTGFYSDTNHASGVAYLHVGNHTNAVDKENDPEWPDSVIFFSPLSLGLDFGTFGNAVQRLRPEALSNLYGSLMGRESITLHYFLTRPKSKGWVRLNTTDPYDNPLVNFNFLDDPDDLELFIKGIRLAFKLVETKAFRVEMGAKYRSKPLRQCASIPFDSDAYWRCHVRNAVTTGWHIAGTARMGPSNDPGAVVTPRLRLRGVSGVRVVDASIMPRVVTVNPMATVIMIGEKGADLIKEDWGYPIDSLV